MRRRDFVKLFVGSAEPLGRSRRARNKANRCAGSACSGRSPRTTPRGKASLAALQQALRQLGWIEDRNLRIDARWFAGNPDDNRKNAAELIALAPDLIFASGSAAAQPLLQATRTIPVVFAIVPDPVGAGFVQNLARPGGNATGFTSFEYGIGAKWVELLKQIAHRASSGWQSFGIPP